MSEIQAIYDEIEERQLRGYQSFEKIYEVQHPPPVKPKSTGITLTGVITIAALIVLVVAAMIVSGSRTIVEFGSVGGAAFLMLEVGSLVYAFRRAMMHENDSSSWLVKLGLIICVVVMLAGNVDATLRAHDIHIAAGVQIAILLAIAVSAPILTFIAGDILGLEVVSISRRREDIMDQYHGEYIVWHAAKLRSWQANQGKWGASVRVERPPSDEQTDTRLLSEASVSEQTDSRQTEKTTRAGYGFNRTSDAQQKAWEWFDANKERVDEPSRKIAAEIGIGHDSVAKARNLWKAFKDAEGNSADAESVEAQS